MPTYTSMLSQVAVKKQPDHPENYRSKQEQQYEGLFASFPFRNGLFLSMLTQIITSFYLLDANESGVVAKAPSVGSWIEKFESANQSIKYYEKWFKHGN